MYVDRTALENNLNLSNNIKHAQIPWVSDSNVRYIHHGNFLKKTAENNLNVYNTELDIFI